MAKRSARTPTSRLPSRLPLGRVVGLTAAFALGVGLACTQQGLSDVDKELAKARKQAAKAKPAECFPNKKEPCYYVDDPGAPGPEGTVGRGICKEGQRQCDPEGFWLACEGAVLPANEVCNKIDDDCNGRVDDGFEREGTKCIVGSGECQAEGTYSCSADGSESICDAKPKEPKAETCDGRDNDCNGHVDDGVLPNTGDACKTGELGACSTGHKECVAGEIKCMPDHTRTFELCNKIDDDCDGKVDDDCVTEEQARENGMM